MSNSLRELKEILATFDRSPWTAMTLDLDGIRVTVGKHGPPSAPPAGAAEETRAEAPAAAPAIPAGTEAPTPSAGTAAPVDVAGCEAVRSPAVGSFWVAPAPGQPPFVEVGQTVTPDQQLAIVEVMKLMNPVVASVAGEVVRVDARNAEMVEYDQVLFWIRPV